MALFKICKGAETNLPQTLTNGYCYFCTDTTNFYIDYTDTYGALTRSKISAKYADKLRYTEDGNFVEIEPTDVLTKNNYETAIGVAATDKNGLMSALDKIKLDGIAENADDNVQSDWSQDTDTDDSYIKNRPFKTINTDDFVVDSNILKLSDNKVNNIRTLGISNVQADQFLKVSKVDSNGSPTAFTATTLDDKFISSKGGNYTFSKTDNLIINTDNSDCDFWIDFLTIKGGKLVSSGTTYNYTVSLTPWSLSVLRVADNPDVTVGSIIAPNIWQMLDDQIAGDHKKLYIRSSSLQFWRSNNGWKKFYIEAEKDRALIYNDQKLIDFNESRLTNLGTPTNDTDAATKKYVDDLVPVEATTSVSGLMSATDKVKLDGVASNAASVTIKTWTTADIV